MVRADQVIGADHRRHSTPMAFGPELERARPLHSLHAKTRLNHGLQLRPSLTHFRQSTSLIRRRTGRPPAFRQENYPLGQDAQDISSSTPVVGEFFSTEAIPFSIALWLELLSLEYHSLVPTT